MNTHLPYRLSEAAMLVALLARLSAHGADPLDQWQWRNPLPNGNALEAVAYANGTFVAVGDGGEILSSPDGTNWTSRYLGPIYGAGAPYVLRDLAWGAATWVAIGGVGTPGGGSLAAILTSRDLRTWIKQSSPSNVLDLSSAVYADSQFAAVGSAYDPATLSTGPGILTSPDGVHWTKRECQSTVMNWQHIAYGNGTFLATGSEGSLLTSPDGANWTFRRSGLPGILDVIYADGRFVALGVGVSASADTLRWTTLSEQSVGIRMAYGAGLFVSTDGKVLWTSRDGAAWTNRGAVTPGGIEDVGYGDGKFVAVGSGALSVSAGGTNWQSLTSALTTARINGVTYGHQSFVAAAGVANEQGVILHSEDGTHWDLCITHIF